MLSEARRATASVLYKMSFLLSISCGIFLSKTQYIVLRVTNGNMLAEGFQNLGKFRGCVSFRGRKACKKYRIPVHKALQEQLFWFHSGYKSAQPYPHILYGLLRVELRYQGGPQFVRHSSADQKPQAFLNGC